MRKLRNHARLEPVGIAGDYLGNIGKSGGI